MATLVQETRTAGRYIVRWDGRNDAGARVASGFYLARLEEAHQTATSRLALLK